MTKEKDKSYAWLLIGTGLAVFAAGLVLGIAFFASNKKEKMIVDGKGELKTVEVQED